MISISATTRRRLAPLLLLIGGLVVAVLIAPQVPRGRTVRLRLDNAASVTGVDVAWTPSRDKAEPLQGGSWRFASGTAPAALDAPVRLPDGRYMLDVTVARGAEEEAFHRVIDLGDADQVTVRLR